MLLLRKSAVQGLDILPGQIPLGAPDLGCRRFIGNNTIFHHIPDHLYSLGFTNDDDNLKLYENIARRQPFKCLSGVPEDIPPLKKLFLVDHECFA